MTTTIEESTTDQTTQASERMRAGMTAVRLAFTWLGVRKTLTSDQKSQAAHSFDAEGKYLSASKKLIDTSHPAFKAVTAIRSNLVSYWKGVSLPFPEPGIRLIKRNDVDSFSVYVAAKAAELDEAVLELDQQYDELRSAARDRLGDLFNSMDYPTTLIGEFGVRSDFPSVEPPNYLRQLSPELYEQECRRVQARFDEAVQLAEQAFTEELAKLVDHLSERLAGSDDGRPKIFRDSAIDNLNEFFARFRTLNVGSNEQLDQLVQQAQRVIVGVQPQSLRDSGQLRQHIATQMAGVQAGLDQLLVDRPRRKIQRRPR